MTYILRDIETDTYKAVGFSGLKASDEFIKTTEREREKLTKKVDPRLLSQYERIMKRYGGRGVVQVASGIISLVEKGEDVIITKRGKPAAVIYPLSEDMIED